MAGLVPPTRAEAHDRSTVQYASAGIGPAIHVFLSLSISLKAWMPGTRLVLGPAEGRTRVPGMTISNFGIDGQRSFL
jgi:hypothetical protein